MKNRLPKKISKVFHNGSNYDYHFIIKELAEEFKKQFTCLGENIEKYITFTVLIQNKLQELRKMEKKLQKYISYILQFSDSARFTAISLLNLFNNLSEGVHIINYKFRYDVKNCETFGIDFLMDTNFLTKTKISLFNCGEKVFIFTNVWVIGKN